jgi:poly-beta-hydroxyalkanoate depolymerase
MIRLMTERASQQRALSLILTGFPFHCRKKPAAPEQNKGNKEMRYY